MSKDEATHCTIGVFLPQNPFSHINFAFFCVIFYSTAWVINRMIALRTIPVILKNGTRKVQVNCLLDEGSDTTYINEDVVEELGLTGVKERIEVKVANDQTISFMSNTFTIGVESTDGRVDTEIL